MDDRTEIERVAHAIAAAIQAKDEPALLQHLAPEFKLRRPGAPAVEAMAFAAGIRAQQEEMLSVELEHLEVDIAGDSAVATGVQFSRVRVEGETVEDRQPFVDWFVKTDGRWRLQGALDFSEW
jgi:ketosteroid isomerase-like protein